MKWFDGEYQHGDVVAAAVYIISIAVIVRFSVKTYRKCKNIGTAQSEDGGRRPKHGKQMNVKVNRLASESEGLEEFRGMKDVGYSKSLEDMLNGGSMSEDRTWTTL